MSSMLPTLVDAAATGMLRISPRRIQAGADPLDPRALDAAEAVFGTRPVESYATTDRAVPAGELSRHILVTSLHQRAVPMIRYRINDRIRIAPPTGRYPVFTRIASIDGRSDDLLQSASVSASCPSAPATEPHGGSGIDAPRQLRHYEDGIGRADQHQPFTESSCR
jgi:phenylacetate-coenzyme A ligase PaaK-like adenylate-forming protein